MNSRGFMGASVAALASVRCLSSLVDPGSSTAEEPFSTKLARPRAGVIKPDRLADDCCCARSRKSPSCNWRSTTFGEKSSRRVHLARCFRSVKPGRVPAKFCSRFQTLRECTKYCHGDFLSPVLSGRHGEPKRVY
jgi:hypothetical protein